MEKKLTFEQFLKKHFGMPEEATIWKPFAPVEGESPKDYGKETWDEVYLDLNISDELDEEHPIKKYWDDPHTKECDEPWKKAIAVVEDLCEMGAIDECTKWDIIQFFCDNA